MELSIIIRTYNEEKYLPELLSSLRLQDIGDYEMEIILVDSGSTDETVQIAKSFGCRIEYIKKDEFSFGKSLNIGCSIATGKILVFISGHCIPVNNSWLLNLVRPIISNQVSLTYGKQIGINSSKFSEKQIFAKYYPETSSIPQNNFFCNNANAALDQRIWEKYLFNEELTGLEDMHLGKRILNDGFQLGYVSTAEIFHIHNENWNKIKNRFEREAIALQRIMPEVLVTYRDFLRYFISSVWLDFGQSLKEKVFFQKAYEIIVYRLAQYWGTYKGNHSHRKISNKIKEQYFFPK
jgi:glycosyltransferase involved in cell wall biosynthesis